MRRWWLVMMLCVPVLGIAQNWTYEYIDSLYSGRQLDGIEGVWQFPRGGARIAVTCTRPMHYDIYLLDSPRVDIQPGTLIGSAVNAPRHNYYEGQLKSATLGKTDKLKSQSVTLTINDDGYLVIRPYKTGFSLSMKRWLYFLFKGTVTDNSNLRPNDIDGAVRIYPYRLTEHTPISL